MSRPDVLAPAGSAAPRKKKVGAARRWIVRLGLLCGAGAVALLIAELLVTLLLGTQVRFPRHVVRAPWGIRYNEPGARYGHHSPDVDIRFAINAQGMRADEDYTYDKPPETKRIVCLGDSFTIGYEVANDECFVRLLERGLTDDGIRCQVMNAGVSGFGNAEELVYFERELVKYAPDVVLLSFFVNDPDDNVRSGLFDLEDGKLVQRAEDYVPLGGIGDFANRNWLMSWLSEHSNAFALVKENITWMLKREIVDQHLDAIEAAAQKAAGGGTPSAPADPAKERSAYQGRLCAAILDRLYESCRQRGIELVVESIPVKHGDTLADVFPYEYFRIDRPGLHFIRCADYLLPHLATTLLYHEYSHVHWTPFAHRQCADRLIATIAPLVRQ